MGDIPEVALVELHRVIHLPKGIIMRQDVADGWTKLLRSEEFPQGGGALRSADGNYCCLGVLCEMAVQEGIIPAAWLQYPTSADYTYGVPGDRTTGDYSMGILPNAVREWAGMSSTNGSIDEDVALSTLNDQGMSFPDIANLIDQNVDIL